MTAQQLYNKRMQKLKCLTDALDRMVEALDHIMVEADELKYEDRNELDRVPEDSCEVDLIKDRMMGADDVVCSCENLKIEIGNLKSEIGCMAY